MQGFIVIDKPSGITSFRVVDIIKKRFKLKKIGHAGTLDPMATGVLVLAIGSATKKIQSFINDDKTYEAILTLGIVTDSHDITGKIVHQYTDDIVVTKEEILNVFKDFQGEIEQIPPMVSAVKHQGKRLYKLAREGKIVERQPRKITIFDLSLKSIEREEISFSVHCSKGTYVRVLAADIGEKLKFGATLSSLQRVTSGRFKLEDAKSLAQLELMTQAEFESLLINI